MLRILKEKTQSDQKNSNTTKSTTLLNDTKKGQTYKEIAHIKTVYDEFMRYIMTNQVYNKFHQALNDLGERSFLELCSICISEVTANQKENFRKGKENSNFKIKKPLGMEGLKVESLKTSSINSYLTGYYLHYYYRLLPIYSSSTEGQYDYTYVYQTTSNARKEEIKLLSGEKYGKIFKSIDLDHDLVTIKRTQRRETKYIIFVTF
jgi:hypothetical protein